MTKLIKRFAEAAEELSRLADNIENENFKVDEFLVEQMQNSLDDVTAAVDRRKIFIKELDSKIEMAKESEKEAKAAKVKYEKLRERVIESTKHVVEANRGIPFKDSLGKKLKVIPNPNPKLVISGDGTNSQYSMLKSTHVLDKETLKKDLISGIECDFAHLEWGTQLRGLS